MTGMTGEVQGVTLNEGSNFIDYNTALTMLDTPNNPVR